MRMIRTRACYQTEHTAPKTKHGTLSIIGNRCLGASKPTRGAHGWHASLQSISRHQWHPPKGIVKENHDKNTQGAVLRHPLFDVFWLSLLLGGAGPQTLPLWCSLIYQGTNSPRFVWKRHSHISTMKYKSYIVCFLSFSVTQRILHYRCLLAAYEFGYWFMLKMAIW